MLCGCGHITRSGNGMIWLSGVYSVSGAAQRRAATGGLANGISRYLIAPSGPASALTTPVVVAIEASVMAR